MLRSKTEDTLGKRIRIARGREPRERVAVAIEKSGSTLANWESDRNVPGKGDLLHLAQYLGVNLDWLTTGEGEMRTTENHSQENPSEITGKNTYAEGIQKSKTLHGADAVNNATTHSNPKEEDAMEAPRGGEGFFPVVQVPEYVDVMAFGQVIMTVRISMPVPSMRHSVDITGGIMNLQTVPRPQDNEEPPVTDD